MCYYHFLLITFFLTSHFWNLLGLKLQYFYYKIHAYSLDFMIPFTKLPILSIIPWIQDDLCVGEHPNLVAESNLLNCNELCMLRLGGLWSL